METLDKKTEAKIVQLHDALDASHFTVAITGAGISIAAGGVTFNGMIRQFRGGMRANDPDAMYEASAAARSSRMRSTAISGCSFRSIPAGPTLIRSPM